MSARLELVPRVLVAPSGTAPCTDDAAPVQAPCADDAAPTAWDAATDVQRKRARARLQAAEHAADLRARGLSWAEADAAAAARAGVSAGVVGAWRRRVAGLAQGARLAALLDAPGRGRPPKMWSVPGAARLWTLWVTDYHRPEAPSGAKVWRRLKDVADDHGWAIPPLKAFLRRDKLEIPAAERAMGRQGALAAMDLVPHQTRTVEGLRPMDIVNGDGRRHDVLVVLPSGRVGRPTVWAWQDVRTRRVLEWVAGETESLDLVRTSLHALIVRYGVMDRVVVDQTLAASAKWLTGGQPGRKRWRSTGEELPGLLEMLDIEYRPTVVDRDLAGRGKGRGRSKPIERAFGDLADAIDTHPALAGASTGRSTTDRPETHRSRAVPWETFVALVDQVMRAHNARDGRDTEAAAGRSFDSVWNEEYAATVVRRVSAGQAGVLLLAGEDVRIEDDGSFRLRCGRAGRVRNRYHHTDLVERSGERLVARFNDRHLHDPVQVYDTLGRWICTAECLAPVAFADSAAGGEYERRRRRMRRTAKESLAARQDLDALTNALEIAARNRPAEAPEVEPAAVRLVTGRQLPEAPPARQAAGGEMAPIPRRRRRLTEALKVVHSEGDKR